MVGISNPLLTAARLVKLVLALSFPASTALALPNDGISVVISRVTKGQFGQTAVIFQISNQSGKGLATVEVTCALLDEKGDPIAVATSLVSNIQKSETAFGQVDFDTQLEFDPNKNVNCRTGLVM